MAKETVALAVRGHTRPEWLFDSAVAKLLDATPSGNLSRDQAVREVQALNFLKQQQTTLDELAREQSEALLAYHRHVREAARDVGQYVMGVCVLLPDEL